jgi:predicted AAA+ superfamily ATPase
MRFVARLIQPELLRASRHFSALILTGPRRSGKTTLLRKLFPRASYHLLEDPDLIARVREDPRAFIEEVRTPAILDEIQNVPQILNYVRTQIDRRPGRKGQWFLTGSQEASLMRGVTESMAGRAAVFSLLPLSVRESPKVSLLRGGFPEVVAQPSAGSTWFRSYVQTYLERDVRAITSIRDLATFRRFLSLLASRCGQILNRTDVAGPLGISVPTVSEWLNILEITGHIILVPPFYENFGKRLIKSPKLYFVDSGLACHLLGIMSERMLNRSPFLGAVFEGHVASEIAKCQLAAGRARALYFFRDQQGLEVDFLVPISERRLVLLEAKASKTVTPAAGEPLARLGRSVTGYETDNYVCYRGAAGISGESVLRPGMRVLSVDRLGEILAPKRLR